jgi:hypothetical protein
MEQIKIFETLNLAVHKTERTTGPNMQPPESTDFALTL